MRIIATEVTINRTAHYNAGIDATVFTYEVKALTKGGWLSHMSSKTDSLNSFAPEAITTLHSRMNALAMANELTINPALFN